MKPIYLLGAVSALATLFALFLIKAIKDGILSPEQGYDAAILVFALGVASVVFIVALSTEGKRP